MSIGGFPTLGNKAEQPEERSELMDALNRLGDAWRTLRQENSRLKDRVESVTRPAFPAGGTNPPATPVAPIRSPVGVSLHETADQLYAEADNVRNLIERLAV